MSTHYIVYVSQADSALTPKDLENILESAHSYNPRHGITGVLLFAEGEGRYRGSFMQLLEGDEAAIEALRKRIFSDPRHHTKIVLERGVKDKRDFPDWSMAFRTVEKSDLRHHPRFAELCAPHFQDRCGPGGMQGALSFLCDFWHEAA
ncbi:BLUF domain-containing protein [Rhodovulum euryhalinum]|uniref:FAD-dependent sensor of blue light n=1 Tax=Rhodovulum euryhalinum TaxID=35805 RepID=A0A4V2SA99_9RHOB|nr:BLUF domain-containing protein [Rhodovulum euryhalinum]TCO70840.1 FAD-dependent sensor of blue light [Rhodovulum euryhalinum]